MAQNELALEFYKGGFFEPSRADQAIATLEMMDFREKNKIIQKIRKNGTMYQQVLELSKRLEAAEKMLGMKNGSLEVPPSAPRGNVKMPSQNPGGSVSSEAKTTRAARERSAQTTIPR